MYPSYQPMSKSKILSQLDRDSIQHLYGKKQSSSQTPTTKRFTITTTASTRKIVTTTRSSSTVPAGQPHPRCRLFLGAAFDHLDGTLHTFNAGILWRYLPNENTWESRTSTFKQTYANLPNKLAAGTYNSRTKEVVFFTDTDVYHYAIDYRNRTNFQTEKLLKRNLQNSIVGAIYYRSEIYIITQRTIRLFQLDNGYKQSHERDLSEEFPGFDGIVAKAFSYRGLHHFFTTDHLVYVWSERLKTWQTFAKPMETNWFACSGTETYITKDSEVKQPTKHQGSHHYDHHHHHHY
jgi:hypothetical protein